MSDFFLVHASLRYPTVQIRGHIAFIAKSEIDIKNPTKKKTSKLSERDRSEY